MSLPELFDNYIKHGLYLKGWSPKTAVVYKRAFRSFQQSTREISALQVLTKAQLEAWIISRREAGMSPAGINIYIRAMNSRLVEGRRARLRADRPQTAESPTKAGDGVFRGGYSITPGL